MNGHEHAMHIAQRILDVLKEELGGRPPSHDLLAILATTFCLSIPVCMAGILKDRATYLGWVEEFVSHLRNDSFFEAAKGGEPKKGRIRKEKREERDGLLSSLLSIPKDIQY